MDRMSPFIIVAIILLLVGLSVGDLMLLIKVKVPLGWCLHSKVIPLVECV